MTTIQATPLSINEILEEWDDSFDPSELGLDEVEFTEVDYDSSGGIGFYPSFYQGTDGNLYLNYESSVLFQEKDQVYDLELTPEQATPLEFLEWVVQYKDYGPGKKTKRKIAFAKVKPNGKTAVEKHWQISRWK